MPSSAAAVKQNQAAAAAKRDLKHRVLTCLHKLSDRDTYASATSELENIAKTLSPDTLPPFLSSITATDSTDKSTVRKQCLHLISLLALHHSDTLSPHLSKLLSSIIRRLRDSDSSIRSACVSAAASLASHLTRPSFSSFSKPFLEALFTEQDLNAQIGAAMCLSAVLESIAQPPDAVLLRKLLVRLEKLVKREGFRAKAAVLGFMGSVIESGGAPAGMMLSNLLACLVQFLSSEDWAARKAAAEALLKLVLAEREALPEFKAASLKIFEAKRFDKVKVVRETMNQLVEAWKEVPDEASANLEYHSSTMECQNASHGQYAPASKTPCTVTSGAPQVRKSLLLCNGSSITTARKRIPENENEKKTGPALFRKLDRKKPYELIVECATHNAPGKAMSDDDPTNRDESFGEKVGERNRLAKPDVKRTLFNKSASRVVPCHEDISEATVVVSNETGIISRNRKDCEDLSLIRKQLVQIENQQSNLLDLLQKFMGSSQSGMRSLETRVRGLELALDEISLDLAVSTGRMSNAASAGGLCCKLPGAEYLSSKLWKRTESRRATPMFTSSSATTAAASMLSVANKSEDSEVFKLDNRRSRYQGGHGIIMNPLAEIPIDSRSIPGVSSNRILENAHVVV
ncbi:TORTIFOLIA1-like protein 3 [Coffea arabica]|uniref:TORTIFOLIA1-like protein 3 n=1 Tax=Coffea arabica TaxID=13443 RepID=A0A6P6XIJ1_COFAR